MHIHQYLSVHKGHFISPIHRVMPLDLVAHQPTAYEESRYVYQLHPTTKYQGSYKTDKAVVVRGLQRVGKVIIDDQ